MTDLNEQRAAIARTIAECDARYAKYLSEIPPPDSFEDYERESRQRRCIEECYRRESNPLFLNLLEYMAMEQRDGYIFLNPWTLDHQKAARRLVEKESESLETRLSL